MKTPSMFDGVDRLDDFGGNNINQFISDKIGKYHIQDDKTRNEIQQKLEGENSNFIENEDDINFQSEYQDSQSNINELEYDNDKLPSEDEREDNYGRSDNSSDGYNSNSESSTQDFGFNTDSDRALYTDNRALSISQDAYSFSSPSSPSPTSPSSSSASSPRNYDLENNDINDINDFGDNNDGENNDVNDVNDFEDELSNDSFLFQNSNNSNKSRTNDEIRIDNKIDMNNISDNIDISTILEIENSNNKNDIDINNISNIDKDWHQKRNLKPAEIMLKIPKSNNSNNLLSKNQLALQLTMNQYHSPRNNQYSNSSKGIKSLLLQKTLHFTSVHFTLFTALHYSFHNTRDNSRDNRYIKLFHSPKFRILSNSILLSII
jgi:hypothetical protein